MTAAYTPHRAARHQHQASPAEAAHAGIPLPSLLHICHEQLGRFQRGDQSDSQFLLELFRRAIDAGDRGAWEALVALYRPLLLARLRRKGASPEMAEDAVQEAFVVLWTKSGRGAFSTHERTLPQVLDYLNGSADFALIKLRRQYRELALLSEGPASRPAEPLVDDGALEQQLDAQALSARLRALLSDHEWQILWKRWGEAIPPRELAPLLGLPVAAIHTTLASTKRRLRNDRRLLSLVMGESAGA